MIDWTLTIFVLLGTLPLLASLFQFNVIGLHSYFNHLSKTESYYPRVAIIVPAWNEDGVIANTVDRLILMDYPDDAVRIYVVDDASTDKTPEIMQMKCKQYAGRVFHLRREKGGEGKAHTLNHGIRLILEEDWAEAFLIIDADVLFEPAALRRMTRHLADDQVGSVTAYIKEGSQPGNLITRFIAFEYITAQAASRRAQNVLGFMACLAGGAQLHTRENMLAIGGQIDTSSLAEDTFTTFKTQLNGRKTIFDGNAIVWAEEPDNVVGVWKQRLRWARGNIQVSRTFKDIWLRSSLYHRLGHLTFFILWFTIILMPIFMILASIGLVGLFFSDFALSWYLFRMLWILNVITYLFVTLYSFHIDPPIARRAWIEGLIFPGLVSLIIIVLSALPSALDLILFDANIPTTQQELSVGVQCIILFMYSWLSINMVFAYLAYKLEARFNSKKTAKALILISGFGALLCAITLMSYIKEFQKAEMTWDKTEKSGKVVMPQ